MAALSASCPSTNLRYSHLWAKGLSESVNVQITAASAAIAEDAQVVVVLDHVGEGGWVHQNGMTSSSSVSGFSGHSGVEDVVDGSLRMAP